MFDNIRAFHHAIKPSGSSVTQSLGLLWSDVFSAGSWQFSPPGRDRRCDLVRALGYRFNGSWAITAQFTNYSSNVDVENRGIWKEFVAGGDSTETRAVSIQKIDCDGRGAHTGSHEIGKSVVRMKPAILPWSEFA